MIATLALAAALSRYVVMHVTVDAYGVPGTGTIVVDRQSGRFVRRFDAGPASEQEGWDGSHAWRADATGMSRVQENSGERSEILQWSDALVHAIGGTAHHVLLSGSTDHVDVTFADYRKAEDTEIPGRIDFRSEQNGQWTARVDLIQNLSDEPASVFAPPQRTKPDFRLDHLTSIPISMAIGLPSLDVRVNGTKLNFAFDTGGQNVISLEAAKRIGLKVLGHGIVSGGAGGTTTIQYATADTVQVGDAQLFAQPFIVLPADALPGVDGIVGYEMLARLAARFDISHGTLELAPDTSAFGPETGPEHFGYDDRHVQVDGSLDGVEGAFVVDTGSSLTAEVQTPVVRDKHLIQTLHATVTAQASDVGGRYPIYLTRARELRLGSATFDDPLVDLMTRVSTSDDKSIVASVGDGILKRWVLVFDYPHQTIDFRPGGDPSPIVVHDHSGIVLGTKSQDLVASQVFGGTPASQAGITEGARITAIDGTPMSANDLVRARTMLRADPGTVVRIQLADGNTRTIVLRKYL